LADRRIRLVVAALVASGWADGFLPVALSFAVLRVTGSVARLGLVLAVQGGFALLLTLAGGLAGDRFPRRRIMVVSLATRSVAAAVMAATLLAGMASFPLLLAMAGVYGCADGFFGPASSALLPEIVPRRAPGPGQRADRRDLFGRQRRGAGHRWRHRGYPGDRRRVHRAGGCPGDRARLPDHGSDPGLPSGADEHGEGDPATPAGLGRVR
jgi:hypothetical protein